MNIVVMIQGREAIPVRAIPIATHWDSMSPDVLAEALAGTSEHFWQFRGLTAHHLEGGAVKVIKPVIWENFVCRDLKALDERIKAKEEAGHITYENGYQEWRRASLEILPAGAFVWKDEFEPLYLARFSSERESRRTDAPDPDAEDGGYEVMPAEMQNARVALDYDPFVTSAFSHLVMEGFPDRQPASARIEAAATGGRQTSCVDSERAAAELAPKHGVVDRAWIEATKVVGRKFTDQEVERGWPAALEPHRLASLQFPNDGTGQSYLNTAAIAACKAGELLCTTIVREDHGLIAGKEDQVDVWTDYLISAEDFARWWVAKGEAPSIHLAAWLSARGVAVQCPIVEEVELGAVVPRTSDERRVVHRSAGTRRHVLLPSIERVQAQCTDAFDTAEVWAKLQGVSARKEDAFIGGSADNGLQYRDGEKVGYLTRKNLSDMLRRMRAKAL